MSSFYDNSDLRHLQTNALKVQRTELANNYSVYANNSTGQMYLEEHTGTAKLMTERMQQKTMSDYLALPFICNVPNQSEIKRLLRQGEVYRDPTTGKGMTLKWENPSKIYSLLIDRTKNCLPKLPLLAENYLNAVYAQAIDNNLINLYNNSPNYFNYIIGVRDVNNKPVRAYENFREYQIFMYLLVHVYFIVKHREEEWLINFDKTQIPTVIEWCRHRMNENVIYQIQGPLTHEDKVTDFKQLLEAMISPSNTQASIAAQLQITTLQSVNSNIMKLNDDLNERQNVYQKNPNIAGAYTISLDTDLNSSFETDNLNNLYINCSLADIGTAINKDIDLNYHTAEVNLGEEQYDPKTASKKLTMIMNQFTMFKIKSLLILKTTYKTSLDSFDMVFVVFPGIYVDGKFNQVYNTGSLQISGHFISNKNDKYWEFIPDNSNGVVYHETTAHVDRLGFYISDKPNERSHILFNNFKIATNLTNFYNCPLLVQDFKDLNKEQKDLKDELGLDFNLETYIIRSFKLNVDGKPEPMNYSFLYNRTYKTIQLLPNNFIFDTVPHYFVMKKLKAKVDTTKPTIIKPVLRTTRNLILDLVRTAELMGSNTIKTPNSIQYGDKNSLIEQIKRAIQIEQKRIVVGGIEYLIDRNTTSEKLYPQTHTDSSLQIMKARNSNEYAILLGNQIKVFEYDKSNADDISQIAENIDDEINYTFYQFEPFESNITLIELTDILRTQNLVIDGKTFKQTTDINLIKEYLPVVNKLMTQSNRQNFIDAVVKSANDAYNRDINSYNTYKDISTTETINEFSPYVDNELGYFGLFKSDFNYVTELFNQEQEIKTTNGTSTTTLGNLISYYYQISLGPVKDNQQMINYDIDQVFTGYYKTVDIGGIKFNILNSGINSQYPIYTDVNTKLIINDETKSVYSVVPQYDEEMKIYVEKNNGTYYYYPVLINGEALDETTESTKFGAEGISDMLIINAKIGHLDTYNIKGLIEYIKDGDNLKLYKITEYETNDEITVSYKYTDSNNNTYDEQVTFDGIYKVNIYEDETLSKHTVQYKNIKIPLKDNINKTFKIGVDLFDINFSTSNFVHSLALLNNAESISTPYYNYIDLKLGMLDSFSIINTQFKYDLPVAIRDYIAYINDLPLNLTINYNDFNMSGNSVKINKEEYVMKNINNQLFEVAYNKEISDITEINTTSSQFKMMIELN